MQIKLLQKLSAADNMGTTVTTVTKTIWLFLKSLTKIINLILNTFLGTPIHKSSNLSKNFQSKKKFQD